MTVSVTPMLNVPDVAATAKWYESIGFAILDTVDDDGVVNWAELALDDNRIMLNAGGQPGTGVRRDVDLHIDIDDVEARFEDLRDRVDVHEAVHDTFYGKREFIIRDLNGFWITFGQQLDG